MNVLVVEDDARVREAIIALLSRASDLSAVGVGSVAEAHDALEGAGPFQVALVDLSLGGESGLEVLDLLERAGVPGLMLTISDGGDDVTEALQRGAVGYLLKDDPPSEIERAVRDAAVGRHPISSGVTRHLLPPRHARTNALRSKLTARETDVLVALARGLSYRETAEALGCSVGTVQTHVKQVYAKLEVNSKTEACALAYQAGLVR